MRRAFLLTVCLVAGIVFGGGSMIVADQVFTGKREQLARFP
jgi:hypothetical protein